MKKIGFKELYLGDKIVTKDKIDEAILPSLESGVVYIRKKHLIHSHLCSVRNG
jgi:hypothetical protein